MEKMPICKQVIHLKVRKSFICGLCTIVVQVGWFVLMRRNWIETHPDAVVLVTNSWVALRSLRQVRLLFPLLCFAIESIMQLPLFGHLEAVSYVDRSGGFCEIYGLCLKIFLEVISYWFFANYLSWPTLVADGRYWDSFIKNIERKEVGWMMVGMINSCYMDY